MRAFLPAALLAAALGAGAGQAAGRAEEASTEAAFAAAVAAVRDHSYREAVDLFEALARAWVDPEFRAALIADALGTFAAAGIHLPATMSIEFTVSGGERPKIVVYEQKEGSRFRMRIFYLQLIMIAGR